MVKTWGKLRLGCSSSVEGRNIFSNGFSTITARRSGDIFECFSRGRVPYLRLFPFVRPAGTTKGVYATLYASNACSRICRSDECSFLFYKNSHEREVWCSLNGILKEYSNLRFSVKRWRGIVTHRAEKFRIIKVYLTTNRYVLSETYRNTYKYIYIYIYIYYNRSFSE